MSDMSDMSEMMDLGDSPIGREPTREESTQICRSLGAISTATLPENLWMPMSFTTPTLSGTGWTGTMAGLSVRLAATGPITAPTFIKSQVFDNPIVRYGSAVDQWQFAGVDNAFSVMLDIYSNGHRNTQGTEETCFVIGVPSNSTFDPTGVHIKLTFNTSGVILSMFDGVEDLALLYPDSKLDISNRHRFIITWDGIKCHLYIMTFNSGRVIPYVYVGGLQPQISPVHLSGSYCALFRYLRSGSYTSSYTTTLHSAHYLPYAWTA